MDPREIFRRYHADLTAQGLNPFSYEEFIRTDMGCYTELSRMKHPPTPPPICIHELLRELQDELADAETIERIGNEVLANVLLAGKRGVRAARAELLDLIDRTDGATDRLAKLWGDLGAGMIRGQTQQTRRVDWWQRWLVDVLASKLAEGERLIYPKKRGAVLAALGQDPTLSRRGPERHRVVAIAVDASGSMPPPVVDWIASLVGQLDGVEAHWLSFDAAVVPFAPGDPLVGGGGTSFQAVADYLEGRAPVGEDRGAVRRDAGRRHHGHRRPRPAHHAGRAGQVDLADHRARRRLARGPLAADGLSQGTNGGPLSEDTIRQAALTPDAGAVRSELGEERTLLRRGAGGARRRHGGTRGARRGPRPWRRSSTR